MGATAIIVAAGRGTRMGAERNKVFLPLGKSTVIEHTLAVFDSCDVIDGIILVTGEDDIKECMAFETKKPLSVVTGGGTRQESVYNGLLAAKGTKFAVIHDGARALITKDIIKSTFSEAEKFGAAAAGVLSKDTLKSADRDGFITATLDREATYLIQTPQIFDYDKILSAHKSAIADGFSATDDCALYEKYIGRVKIYKASYENIKLTTPEDMIIAEGILKRRKPE